MVKASGNVCESQGAVVGKAYTKKKQPTRWPHGQCPYCGSHRVTGIYVGEKLVRLHCYDCHTGWEVKE